MDSWIQTLVTELSKLDGSTWCFFLWFHNSIALTSTLCGPVISKTVWCSSACLGVLWGISMFYLTSERVLTAEPGLCIRGTASVVHKGPPGSKCKSLRALHEERHKRVCTRSIHARSPSQTFDFRAFSHIMFVFGETCSRWCDELHNVWLGELLWELKQSPTWEITVTNGDRPDISLPLTLFPSSVFLYSLHPSPASPISKICIHFEEALLAWQTTMPSFKGKMLLTLYLSLHSSLSLSPSPYENLVFQSDLICFIGI